MDLRTVIERIKADTSRKAAQDTYHVQRAVEAAIRHYKRTRFFFNEGSGTFELEGENTTRGRDTLWLITDDESEPDELIEDPWSGETPSADPGTHYEVRHLGFPKNMIRVISLYYSNGKPLRHMGISGFRSESRSSFALIARPRLWTLTPDDQLGVFPVPSPGMEMHMDFVADIGSPVLQWVDGDWIFTIGGEPVDDEYTNSWFVEGQDLIAYRAQYLLWFGTYSETEKAMRAKGLEKESYDILRSQFEANDEPQAARPRWAADDSIMGRL